MCSRFISVIDHEAERRWSRRKVWKLDTDAIKRVKLKFEEKVARKNEEWTETVGKLKVSSIHVKCRKLHVRTTYFYKYYLAHEYRYIYVH